MYSALAQRRAGPLQDPRIVAAERRQNGPIAWGRILAAVLLLVLVLGVAPAAAWADPPGQQTPSQEPNPSDWQHAIPWESLKLSEHERPGWFANGIIALSRWASAQWIPVLLLIAILVLGLTSLALFAGLTTRTRAMVIATRILMVIALVALIGSGALVTLSLSLGQSIASTAP